MAETPAKTTEKKTPRRKYMVAPHRSFFLDQEDGKGNKKRKEGEAVMLTAAEAKQLSRGGFIAPFIPDEEEEQAEG